jgi:hypothetical protein
MYREGLFLNKIGTPAVLLFNPSRVHGRSPGKKIFILGSYFSHSVFNVRAFKTNGKIFFTVIFKPVFLMPFYIGIQAVTYEKITPLLPHASMFSHTLLNL